MIYFNKLVLQLHFSKKHLQVLSLCRLSLQGFSKMSLVHNILLNVPFVWFIFVHVSVVTFISNVRGYFKELKGLLNLWGLMSCHNTLCLQAPGTERHHQGHKTGHADL